MHVIRKKRKDEEVSSQHCNLLFYIHRKERFLVQYWNHLAYVMWMFICKVCFGIKIKWIWISRTKDYFPEYLEGVLIAFMKNIKYSFHEINNWQESTNMLSDKWVKKFTTLIPLNSCKICSTIRNIVSCLCSKCDQTGSNSKIWWMQKIANIVSKQKTCWHSMLIM